MGFIDRVKEVVRPQRPVKRPAQAKSSTAGPMIAWSGVGQPKWTPRRYDTLAEEGFRKNVIAYRCVMQIANACSAVPWLAYDAQNQELDQHPILDLLNHPNPLQDGVSFMESVYANLEIAGNAYVEAVRPRDGEPPVELYVLRPDRMKIIPGNTGFPQGYQYNVNGQVTGWASDPLTGASSILHLKRFHPLDDWYGMAPMEAALLSIDQHNAAGAWNQALLGQGARPSGALVYAPKDGPATLSDDQVRRLKEEIDAMYSGSRNAGRPLMLEGGLDWKEMSLSPKDMDWLAGRNNAARDIAVAFGVPAQLIGIPDAQTYANLAEARMAFYEETVIPNLTRVTAGFDHWLSPMFRDDPRLDFDTDCISALTEKRQTQWNRIQSATFLTRNERREAAGYGPVPGGDADDAFSDSDDPDPVAGKFNPNHDPGNGRFTFGTGGDSNSGTTENAVPPGILDIPDSGATYPYSSRRSGWHDYIVGPTLICSAAKDCTTEEIADQLSRYAVPGQDPTVPAKDGQVSVVFDPRNGLPGGEVRTTITQHGLVITNTTQPSHILYDGVIIRSTYQDSDGAWYIVTRGYGNNVIPGMAEFNQWQGPKIFDKLDQMLKDNIERHH